MTKPLVYNYRKAEDTILDLRGQVVRLSLDLDYYKRKCETYREELRRLKEKDSGASCE